MSIVFETSVGSFVVDLYTTQRPKTCLNFLKLCKYKYYNNTLFHYVQRHNVAQTGDPSGTGRGGSSIFGLMYGEQAQYYDSEISPKIRHKRRGLISMVNNGKNQHGSQFFVTLDENLLYLDGTHTVFGEIVEGLDVIEKFNDCYVDKKNRPFRNIRIHHTLIIDDPYDDPKLIEFPGASPIYVPDIQLRIESEGEVRLEEDEVVNDYEGLNDEQIEELEAKNKAKSHAKMLTILGDIPDEDVKPPDNVLFVCKLNPVTTDEDLEIIFSRFGEILSCEVIRDKRTGDSLQYAFIEFEKEESVENAIFKMENVVIDDRRIHVDFSQSVAKEWNKYNSDNKIMTARKNNNPKKRKFEETRSTRDNEKTKGPRYIDVKQNSSGKNYSDDSSGKNKQPKSTEIFDKLINMLQTKEDNSSTTSSDSSDNRNHKFHKKKKKKSHKKKAKKAKKSKKSKQ